MHEDLASVVEHAWNLPTGLTNPVSKFKRKIREVQKAMTIWAQQKFQARDTYLSRSKWALQQIDRAEEVRDLNSNEFGLRIKLKEHIFQLAREKEAKWKQRSGCRWLKLGDQNTKYFHACANGRKNSNRIINLQRDDGTTLTSSQVEIEVLHHFKQSLGRRRNDRPPFDLTGKVGPNHQNLLSHLDQTITQAEIHEVINQMPKDKASNPDGLPV